ncbi:AarF/ABC1/UbiB kinase family protein [Aphanizomenon flos-aquae NRERC-008]|uniref:AarF/ABC1/UbiB kinase family protein n=1 Tax=Aphanizomenon flos-aquae FACHB-1249 TaxID=2692889 RepID=A0ABR8IW92_APHFL|nr:MULTISPECIES: AarF/UbiB family protein [Aphanizomenon]MBD2391539.1 AarF/ABC1/UbiB kinase family protein [Aphanizomenon flos-aquae FACHB-1171]MBD2556046.1 AarF/ABC1/UbiB kinase family protein [Aphanizomenon flos-aquae FACHB-1290]MBD2633152.1 AarF/ABC1/UbiB kinase family protein [Aphanizomenon sp. FACHB-1399]MBD2658097.1 AarF/ABC1/UbiB kinase family protein [Aphanizomenon flos-aquae FACHB-1265]MBD2674804.1 AarF/ABC1/UbiB kinase family protein [Aphanizomenon flos-aquae FACHB-1416]MBD2686741.1
MGQYQSTKLKQYNPETIARYFRYRPWLAWGRLLRIIWSFAGFIFSLKWDEWQDQVEENQGKRATQLRTLLTNLGPTFIKVGQALSTRPDLIRKDFLAELVKLQDQLPAFDSDLAYQIIETDLQRPISKIFRELSPQPIAAASLGQVYKGRLLTGEEVAVKVQRPNLRPLLTKDLYLMRWVASWLAPWLPLNLGHDLTLIVDEFGTKLFEEIDYINEGRNAEKFAHNFRNDPQVKVPSIYWNYTSNHVLTLEWINGFKLTDTHNIQSVGLDPEKIIQVGVTTGLQQLLEHGFFHADPHPGNLFAMSDGRMAYIDFGMMDQLEETTKESLVDALVHLVNKDYADLAVDFVNLGFLTANTNIAPIVPALEAVLGNAIGKNVQDFNFKTITDEFSELMYEYPFRVPAKFALIIRSLVTQEGIALSLNPNFKIVEVGYPYIARRLLTGESPALRRRLLNVLFKDGKFQWQRLENLITIARTDSQFDVLPTAKMGLEFILSEEGKFLRRQLVLALTEDDRLHTEEVQRLWDLVKDDLPPNRLINVAISLLTEFSKDSVAAILAK